MSLRASARIWVRPVLGGLVAWVIFRGIVEISRTPGTAGPVPPVPVLVAVLAAAAGAAVAAIDLRWSREAVLLENHGVRRGFPVALVFVLALAAEVLLRVAGVLR